MGKAETTKNPRAKGNGNGTVWLMPTGKWRWEVTVSISSMGERKRRSGTCATKKEAEKAARDALVAKDKGGLSAPSKITFGDWLNTWLEVAYPLA